MPSGDSWFLAGNYMDACRAGSWWPAIFTRLHEHWLVFCKAGLFAGFEWLGGDSDRLTLIAWLSILIAVLRTTQLSQSWVQTGPPRSLNAIWFTCALLMFTLGQTYFLQWEACFFLHLPLLALLLMHGILSTDLHWTIRVILAALAGTASVLTFGMGIVAAIAIIPVIVLDSRADRWKVSVSWFLIVAALAYLQFEGVRAVSTENATVSRLLTDPAMAIQFALAILGSPVAWGTAIDPTRQSVVLAAIGLLIFSGVLWTLWLRRSDKILIKQAAPWISVTLSGLGAAALITAGRLSENFGIAITGRYVVLALPFTLGLFMLVSLLWSEKSWFRQMIPLFITLLVLNWFAGASEMSYWQARNRYERSSMMLLPHLPIEALPGLDLVEGTDRLRDTLSFLREKKVLRRVPEVAGIDLTAFDRRAELTVSRAEFKSLQANETGWLAVGRAVLPSTQLPPDLILISFESDDTPARIVDTAIPTLPVNYFENATRVRSYREFYNGWQRQIKAAHLPAGKTGWLRAWAWDLNTQRIAPMSGRHAITIPSTQPSVGETAKP